MAVKPYVLQSNLVNNDGATIISEALVVKWAGMANGDTGQEYICPQKAEKNVHVKGTPGAGLSLTIRGSNIQPFAEADAAQLHDPGMTLFSISTSPGTKTILENMVAVSPKVAAGDGTTSVDVYMVVTSPRRGN